MENQTVSEVILHVTYLYLLILVLALLVERTMEVLMSCYELLEYKCGWYRWWQNRAERLRERFARRAAGARFYQAVDTSALLYLIRDALLGKKAGYSGRIPIISPQLLRHLAIATAARVVASGIGIGLCAVTRVDVVRTFNIDLQIDYLNSWPRAATLVMSGIIVGLGSEPVHSLIQAVERRRKRKEAQAEAGAPGTSGGR
ncbi:MAG: hypothetical protein ONB25_03290 [candidate division KSB1 bacterium]|nr:hypothetical protein [candidate division KSB1 bacterium]